MADAGGLFVKMADEAVNIGPAPARYRFFNCYLGKADILITKEKNHMFPASFWRASQNLCKCLQGFPLQLAIMQFNVEYTSSQVWLDWWNKP